MQPGERTRCETFVYLLMERLAPGSGPPINQTNPSLPLRVEAWCKTWQREFVSTSGNVSNKAGRQPWSPTGVFFQITIQVELVWLLDWLGCEVLVEGCGVVLAAFPFHSRRKPAAAALWMSLNIEPRNKSSDNKQRCVFATAWTKAPVNTWLTLK